MWVTHIGWTERSHGDAIDGCRGVVRLGLDGHGAAYAHGGAAGADDGPTPHDLFCGALAAEADSMIRVTAARTDAAIAHLAVIVTCDLDARGTLGLGGPVAIQSVRVEIQLTLAGTTAPARRLVDVALARCALLQTLHASVPVAIVFGLTQ
jgi:uncharacterized OsmC-like protein